MPVVLVRRFRPGDEEEVMRLIGEATMSTVVPFFKRFATREIVSHLALLSAAVSFVVVGTSFLLSLLALPMALFFTYLCVWMAHRLKMRCHKDMDDVASAYLSSEKTGFWVAEVVDETFVGTRYEVEGSSEAVVDLLSAAGSGRLVGTVAVTVKKDPDMREPPGSVAWLRRMAVDDKFKRQGLGAKLVDVVHNHCARAGFTAVELVTTEAHEAARYFISN